MLIFNKSMKFVNKCESIICNSVLSFISTFYYLYCKKIFSLMEGSSTKRYYTLFINYKPWQNAHGNRMIGGAAYGIERAKIICTS